MMNVSRRTLVVAAGLVAVLSGCETYGVVGPGVPMIVSIGGDSASPSSQLIGTWRRTLFFTDSFGFANANETTWQFSRDGSAVRVVTTRNFTLGVADSVTTSARWQVQGNRVIIDLVSPDTGHLELEFHFDAGQLILGGEAYTRVS